jgi:hypothetical protein
LTSDLEPLIIWLWRRRSAAGTQFACFTSTKVQILTQRLWLLRRRSAAGTQFTCFTGTKLQILTQKALQGKYRSCSQLMSDQFTCFTSTKVQILTQTALQGKLRLVIEDLAVLSLLALLVQKCKY